jgi:hypothetical protein
LEIATKGRGRDALKYQDGSAPNSSAAALYCKLGFIERPPLHLLMLEHGRIALLPANP